jgi:hypothetical protein
LRRNSLLKHVIEDKIKGRIEVTGRRGKRRKQLLDDINENRGYWKLKEEALDLKIVCFFDGSSRNMRVIKPT